VTRLGRHRKRGKRTKAVVCDGKERYATREAAQQVRRGYIATGTYRGAVHVYRCPHCDHFHVGRGRPADFRQAK
jgi:hypothetical protein